MLFPLAHKASEIMCHLTLKWIVAFDEKSYARKA